MHYCHPHPTPTRMDSASHPVLLPMRVELQIRTNGMDFWATLEHQLRYKKGIEEMPGYDEISEELLHSARAIIEADNEMQRIKDKIGMFHEI